MRIRSWVFGAIAGVLAGLIVAGSMTFVDWRLNPSGMFHNEQGTNWTIVSETALSWFWPVALLAFATTTIIHFSISRVRNR